MNQPDKRQITDWMNGTLKASERDRIEAWANQNPDEAQRLVGEMETSFAALATLPKDVQPPYADFMNSRICQSIKNESVDTKEKSIQGGERNFWRGLQLFFIPVALATMVACFLLGMRFAQKEDKQFRSSSDSFSIPSSSELVDREQGPLDGEAQNSARDLTRLIYIPSEAVSVAAFDTAEESFIVLEGLDPIGDEEIVQFQPQKEEQTYRYVADLGRNFKWY